MAREVSDEFRAQTAEFMAANDGLLHRLASMTDERDDCQLPCDADCEIGPVHCWNWHRPDHKPDWHDPQECDQGR